MTLYLLDSHNATISSSRIIDVIRGPWSDVPINGKFFMTVPDDMVFDTTPTTAGDLSTAKYTELLTRYPGFTNIAYDDLFDTLAFGGSKMITGERVTAGMTVGSLAASNNVSFGYAPTHVVFLVDLFEQETVTVGGLNVQRLKPSDASNVDCIAYFDMNPTPVVPGMYTNIPSPSQGTSFSVEMTNTSPNKTIWVGSWALIY